MVTLNKLIYMKFLIVIVIMNLLSNCKDNDWNDDGLSIKREPYTGSLLRIDGYYYEKYAIGNGDYRYNIYFFYKNGTVLYGETPSGDELQQKEAEYISGSFYVKIKEQKYYWGLFKVENNNIKFERWYPGDPPLKAYIREGNIINDSTFIITESYRMQGGKKTEVRARSETFHFKAFSPKPDSTNKFIP